MMNRFVCVLVATCFGLTAMDSAADEVPRVVHNVDDNLDRVPLQTVFPDYPKNARRDRIEGEVQVCFNVNRDGKPFRLAVRNSTHRIFEKPSVKAVRESSYRPLPKDKELSGIKTCRTFRFLLEPVEIDQLNSSVRGSD